MALNKEHATSASLYEIKSSHDAYHRARTNNAKQKSQNAINNARAPRNPQNSLNPMSAYASAHANSMYGKRRSYHFQHDNLIALSRAQTVRSPYDRVNIKRDHISRMAHARSMDISSAQKVCKEYYFTYGVPPKKTEHLIKFATSIGRKLAYADARLAIQVCGASFNEMVTDRSHESNKMSAVSSVLRDPVVLRKPKNEEKAPVAGDYYDSDDDNEPAPLFAGVFPDELEEQFHVLPRAHDQCANETVNGTDRRKIVDTNQVTWCSRIGLLRMKFKGIDKTFIGTATVFYCNDQTKRVYAITCAHNLRHYNAFEKKHHQLETLWFEHRLTSNWWGAKYTSSCVKRYNVDYYFAHYKFDPSKTVKPFDLGIVSFVDHGGFYVKQKKELNNFAPFPNAALLGFPGDKKGQLWGDWEDDSKTNHGKKKYGDVFTEKEFPDQGGAKMVSYDMQTTAGQSGSSIIFNKKIVAIHTMGADKNWGIKLEKMHRDWIERKVLKIEGKKNWGLFGKCPFQNLFG